MKMINTYGVILASKKELFGKIIFIPTEIIMFYNLKTARENFNRILKQKSQKINGGYKEVLNVLRPVLLDYNDNYDSNCNIYFKRGVELSSKINKRSKCKYKVKNPPENFYIFLVKIEIPYYWKLCKTYNEDNALNGIIIYKDYFANPSYYSCITEGYGYILNTIKRKIEDDNDNKEYLLISNIQYGKVSMDDINNYIVKNVMSMRREGGIFNESLKMPVIKISFIK